MHDAEDASFKDISPNMPHATSMEWLRSVGSTKLGRAPKLPRAIRVGPNEGDTKIGRGVIREFI